MDSQAITGAAPVGAPLLATPRPVASPTEKSVDAKKTDKPVETAAPPAEPHVAVQQRDPRSLQYQVDSETHQVVATIVDENNKVVIQQIPDAEMVRIAQSIGRMQGFLLEGKA